MLEEKEIENKDRKSSIERNNKSSNTKNLNNNDTPMFFEMYILKFKL